MSNSCHSKPPEGIQTDSVRLSAHLARRSNAQELARSRLGLTRFPVVPVCSELRTLGNYIWPPAPDPQQSFAHFIWVLASCEEKISDWTGQSRKLFGEFLFNLFYCAK